MDEKVMVYIDNSNIFNETQKHSARKKRFLGGVIDVNCRVDVGKLMRVAVHRVARRRVIHGKLYGSEPPALDTVWKAIREKRIQVYHTKRSVHNHREKQTDTGLVNAATEDLIEKIDEAGDYRTVILFTGDSDMMPVVRTGLRKGWKVEIWSYEAAMANVFRQEAKVNQLFNIFKIDDYFEQVTFSVIKWPGQIPEERAMVLSFEEKIAIDRYSDRMTKEQVEKLKDVIYKAIYIFQLPFTGKYLQEANESYTRELALVPCCPESRQNPDSTDRFYDFNDHIWDNQRRAWFEEECECKVMTFIEYLDQKKDIDFDGILEGDDATETETQDNNKGKYLDHFDNAVADDYKLVLHRKTKKSQIYSDYCKYGFNCVKGMKCSHAHREVEKEFFKEHPTINRRLYKCKICSYHINHRCKYDRLGGAKTYLCPFVHDENEKRCLVCKTQGIHWTDECDVPREEKGLREYDRTSK